MYPCSWVMNFKDYFETILNSHKYQHNMYPCPWVMNVKDYFETFMDSYKY